MHTSECIPPVHKCGLEACWRFTLNSFLKELRLGKLAKMQVLKQNRSHIIQPTTGTCVNRNLCYTGVMKGQPLTLLLFLYLSAPIFNSYRWDGILVWSFESLLKSFSLGVREIIRHFPQVICKRTVFLPSQFSGLITCTFSECINKSNYLKPEQQDNTISMTWCKVHFKIKWILRKPHPFSQSAIQREQVIAWIIY